MKPRIVQNACLVQPVTPSQNSLSSMQRKLAQRYLADRSIRSARFYEGMFKEELDAASERHPNIAYEPQLIDAPLALLLATSGEGLVIPTLNRDGDLLSDLVLKMFGTLAASESMVLSFDESLDHVRVVMAEAPHGTAPALEGRDVANPMAMILACAGLLTYVGTNEAAQAARAIYEAVFDGVKTADVGGHASTTDFTNEVIRRVKSKLEVWSSLS